MPQNTAENAHLPSGLTLVDITAALHMPRAIGCFRQVGFEVKAYPIEYTARNISYVKTVFGPSSQTRLRLDTAMKEWIGLLVYRLAGKTNELSQQPHRANLRCPHIREVSNPFAIGSRRVEAAVEHVRSDGGRLPLTQIGRQAPPARTCFESLKPHQPLNPMQTA